MIKIVDRNIDPSVWNKHAAHPMQSWEWGEARIRMGIEVLRIGVYKKDQLHAAYQITLHTIPHTPYRIGYIPRSLPPSDDVLEYLAGIGRRMRVITFKIEPNAVYGTQLDSNVLRRSETPLFPEWTQTLTLKDQTEESLLAAMKPKTRYNIRLASKKGVVVREMTNDEGFEIFIKLYMDTCRRQNYHGHNVYYHKQLFDSLKKTSAHILIASYNGEPLGAYELLLFNNRLYYPYGGSSIAHRDVMAPNLLMWEAIRYGLHNGAEEFDLWGSLAPDYDPHHIWSGFTRFKEGYGAQFTRMMGSYELVINPLLYRIYVVAQKIRERSF